MVMGMTSLLYPVHVLTVYPHQWECGCIGMQRWVLPPSSPQCVSLVPLTKRNPFELNYQETKYLKANKRQEINIEIKLCNYYQIKMEKEPKKIFSCSVSLYIHVFPLLCQATAPRSYRFRVTEMWDNQGSKSSALQKVTFLNQ